jgi:TrpR-related protein YerC/YecD
VSEKKIRTGEVERLLEALAALNTSNELYPFLLDVCTPREITEIAQRLEVARLLSDKVAYSLIQKRTGASATTIARVSKCLNYGEGGYATVLERLDSSGRAS